VPQLSEQEENEMKPHKHAELIKAWADGAEIQYRYQNFIDWYDIENPNWDVSKEYRIKPTEKVVRWLWVYRLKTEHTNAWVQCNTYMTDKDANINFSDFDYKKIDYTRMEFDE
jgi:hypothetical protein